MNELSTTELNRMRTHAEATMFDECVLLRYIADELDEFNVPTDTWQGVAEDDTYACGFRIVKNREFMDESEVVMIDAELRLPFDIEFDRRDRIKLTKRLGEDIAEADQPVYRIVGQPLHGHQGIVVQLVKETEGSEDGTS